MSAPLVKICGLTRPGDVAAAVDAGADLVGFIFAAGSPRRVDVATAGRLRALVPAGVEAVGVFTQRAGAEAVAEEVGLDRIQLYGDVAGLPRAIAAVRGDAPGDGEGPVLLDLPFGSHPGPAALEAHWRRAAAVRRPVMLAGSLDPDNVAEAVRIARPWAVDTARGVETSPGVKDHRLVRRFIREAKEAL